MHSIVGFRRKGKIRDTDKIARVNHLAARYILDQADVRNRGPEGREQDEEPRDDAKSTELRKKNYVRHCEIR